MYLTWDEIESRFKPGDFESPYTIMLATSKYFACGVSGETAKRIYDRYAQQKTKTEHNSIVVKV